MPCRTMLSAKTVRVANPEPNALGSVFKIRSSTQLVVTELANGLLVHLCVSPASRALAKSEYIGHRSWTYGRPSPLISPRSRLLSFETLAERLDPDPRDELLMGPRPIPSNPPRANDGPYFLVAVLTCPHIQHLTRAKLAGEAASVSHNTTGTMWLERNEVVKGWSKVQSRSIRSLNNQSPGILWGCVVAGL